MTTTYLTGVSNDRVRAVAKREGLAILIQPGTQYYRTHMVDFVAAAIDNGCFSEKTGRKFDDDLHGSMTEYLAMIRRVVITQKATAPKTPLLWATAPDKLDWFDVKDEHGNPVIGVNGKPKRSFYGNAKETLRRAAICLPLMRDCGVPRALVLQDGMEDMPVSRIPWDDFEVAFIGGSDDFKLRRVEPLVREALRRGKRVHMGRVSSRKRYALAASWGCETVDGTYIKYGEATNLPKLIAWSNEFGINASKRSNVRSITSTRKATNIMAKKLTPREALALKAYKLSLRGYSATEIGEKLGKPRSTVWHLTNLGETIAAERAA